MSTSQDLIKRLRASGLSQQDISRKTGIPQPRVSRWEAGRVARGADDALKLHALLQEVEAAKDSSHAAIVAGPQQAVHQITTEEAR